MPYVTLGITFWRKVLEKVHGRREAAMQGVIDNVVVYIDSGLLSGLEAMSEMRELLDGLYGSLD